MRRSLWAVAGVSAAVLVIAGVVFVQQSGQATSADGRTAIGAPVTDGGSATGVVPVSVDESPPPTPVLTGDLPIGDPQRCDGVELAGARPVTDPSAVVGLTLCRSATVYRPGLGFWSTWESARVPVDRVPGLAALLPVIPFDGMCIAIGYQSPTVAVTLADGSRFVAQVPGGACDGGAEASAALNQLVTEMTPVMTVLEVTVPERALTTGCHQTKAIYPEVSVAGSVPALPAGALSACRYTTDAAQDTTLQAAGPADFVLVRRLLDSVGDAPPAGCAAPGTDDQVGDFLTVVATPPPVGPGVVPPRPDGLWLFGVQTDECHLVVDGSWRILGWADPALVAELVAGTS